MEETWLYVVSTFAVLLLSKLLWSKTRTSNYRKLPPSPPKLPILGHLHLIKKPLHRCFQNLSKKYGPIVYLSFGSKPAIVISSPALVQECFTKNDVVLANRPVRLSSKYLHYDSTTVAASNYGDLWRNLRRLYAVEILSTTRLNMFMGIRQEEVKLLVKNLFESTSISDQIFTKVEMRSRISELSFNIIMRMIAGKKYFGTKVEDIEEAKRFCDIIREIFDLSTATNLGDYFQILRWLDYKKIEKRMNTVRKDMDIFFQSLIDEHRNNKKISSQHQDKTNKTMIDVVLSLQECQPEYYSDQIIKGLIMTTLAAGTDTSSVTIEWAMSLLLNHPDVLRKAKAELDSHIGQDHLVDEQDLSNLNYLHCIISETFRLFPAAPLLVPHHSANDCIIGGYDVPRGTDIFINAWALHRDPSVWENPTSFRPERFEGSENEAMNNAYSLIPFGLGRRSCPGAGLANKVVGLALASLIQCFEWERISEEEIDLTEGTGLTMPKFEPLEVICKTHESMIPVLSKL